MTWIEFLNKFPFISTLPKFTPVFSYPLWLWTIQPQTYQMKWQVTHEWCAKALIARAQIVQEFHRHHSLTIRLVCLCGCLCLRWNRIKAKHEIYNTFTHVLLCIDCILYRTASYRHMPCIPSPFIYSCFLYLFVSKL